MTELVPSRGLRDWAVWLRPQRALLTSSVVSVSISRWDTLREVGNVGAVDKKQQLAL